MLYSFFIYPLAQGKSVWILKSLGTSFIDYFISKTLKILQQDMYIHISDQTYNGLWVTLKHLGIHSLLVLVF